MVWSIGLLAVLIGLDQSLKYWTVTHLALGESAELIPGFLQLTRLHNYGAAWSSLSGKVVALLVVTGALMLAGSAVKLQTMEEFILYYYNASDTAQPVGSTVLLDNFNVIAGYYDAPEQPSLSYSGTDLVIDNKEVIMFTAKTAVDLKAQLQAGFS